jgi:hypothetical protein
MNGNSDTPAHALDKITRITMLLCLVKGFV